MIMADVILSEATGNIASSLDNNLQLCDALRRIITHLFICFTYNVQCIIICCVQEG